MSVANGTVFPNSGNFTVKIDDELLLVTGISSNTLTVTRGSEGTTNANHANTTPVDFVLSKRSFTQFLGERTLSTDIAGLPGSPDYGQQARLTDSPLAARYNGTAWQYFGPSYGPFDGATFSDFSNHTNWSTYAYGNQTGPGFLLGDTGGDSGECARFALKALGNGVTTIQTAYQMHRSPQTDVFQAGVVLQESSSGKSIRVVFHNRSNGIGLANVYRYTNITSFDTALLDEPNVLLKDTLFSCVTIDITNTTIAWKISPDFVNWRLAWTGNYTSFFTPDQIGYMVHNYSAPGDGSGDCFLNVLHSKVTNVP